MNNIEKIQIEEAKETLDLFASQALTGLISKSPFFDKLGEIGNPASDEVRNQVSEDLVKQSYHYARLMMIERHISHHWIDDNSKEFINDKDPRFNN